ncbi:hypothetical protein ACIPY5_15025 [Microbacterium sp. NPDC089698]|uniref:hypothetical protein n=1 Tax=Microbacterium sp. NPDC089698 TaxID=3364200 RepID=UPI0037F2AD83
MTWKPSFWARLFRRADSWELEIDRIWFQISIQRTTLAASVEATRRMEVERGWLWTTVVIAIPGNGDVELCGMRHRDFDELRQLSALANAELDRLNQLGRWYEQAGATIRLWWDDVRADWIAPQHRWIPLETLRGWQHAKPVLDPGFLVGA